MAAESQRLTEEERANLVAYLDGELDEIQARNIGTKLTLSVTARREIESLQKTWELLDFLPQPEVSEDLAVRTVTVALNLGVGTGKYAEVATRTARIATRVLTCAATALIVIAISYALTRWAWPDPTARLARDLPIAERLDEYREVGDIDFLKLLDGSADFNAESE